MLHATGNKYKTKDGLICLLSTFMFKAECYCIFITIADSNDFNYKGFNGNRWKEPIKVENPYNVSEEEMKVIAGEVFELYTDLITI